MSTNREAHRSSASSAGSARAKGRRRSSRKPWNTSTAATQPAITGQRLNGAVAAIMLFGLALLGYCHTQSAIVSEAFRIRLENETLVAALSVQTAEAEASRGRAERANIAKSQYLAAASHDLRQPLYALSLFSASLEQLRLNAESRVVVKRIQESIAVMESLFNGLLEILALEAGVIVPRLVPVSIDTLFDRTSAVFWTVAAEKGL